jgi:hypothetical protein
MKQNTQNRTYITFVINKWDWDRVVSEYVDFPLSVSIL